MTPIQYCYEKIAQHGYPSYYSIKKVKPEKRDALIIVESFYHELESLLLSASNPDITCHKLNWWRHEITHLTQGRANHPVTKAMYQAALTNIQPYLNLIDGFEQTFAFQTFDTFEDVVVHVMRTGGVRELLLAELLNLSDIPKETIYRYTLVLELSKYIQYLHHYVRSGLIIFARDELQKFNVSVDMLYTYHTTPAIKNFLEFQVEKIKRAYHQAQESLTPRMFDQLKHIRARCDVSLATLQEIQQSDFKVLENFIQLTPLKMWWVAYRA